MPSPHLLDWEAASCGMWASVKDHSYSRTTSCIYVTHKVAQCTFLQYVCALYVLLPLFILSTQQTKIVYLLLWLWDGAHGLEATYIHTRQQHTHKQPEHDVDKRPPRHTTCTYTYVVCTGIMPLVKLGHRWRITPMESPGHVYRQLTNVSTGVCLCLYS